MKILLLNPPRFQGIPVIREERCEITERYSVLPPYSLLQIASILRQNKHDIYLIDANGQNLTWRQILEKMQQIKYDVLIFRFTPTTFDWDMITLKMSKKINSVAKTIGLCWTLSSIPNEVMEDCPFLDIFILNDYEISTPRVIKSLEMGTNLSAIPSIAFQNENVITINPKANQQVSWDQIPLPAYDLLPGLSQYYINTPHGSPFTIMYTSKGCPYSCTFCTERRTPLKKRSAQSIIEEIHFLKENYNIKTISFFDETFTIDRDRVIQLVRELLKNKIKITWYCNTRVNLVDYELLKIMYQGGCKGISYGIESGSQKILNECKKGTTVQQGYQAIQWAKKFGIKTYCSFIFGLPGENLDTIEATNLFVKNTLPTSAQFNVAVPYPGTELYDIILKNGTTLLKKSWKIMYQHKTTILTSQLSRDEVDAARIKAYRRLYSNPRWWVSNIKHIMRHPSDLTLAYEYVIKIVNNYLIHGMSHSH